MKNVTIFSFLLLGLLLGLNGQESILTESETHIFWQSDRILTKNDFKGDCSNNPKLVKLCEENDLCTHASLGFFTVLDIPKKKREAGKFLEKAYFVPAFEKITSCIIEDDSIGIYKQKVVFDIYEVSARYARKQLALLQDSIEGYGIVSIMFKSVESKSIDLQDYLVHHFTKDVYIEQKEGAYLEWRSRIDSLLVDLEEFATKPEDCYRFVKGSPLDKNYKMAKKIIGDMFEEK
ncbi:MAG: hypothetical protein K8R54_11010 [Bacteroidales bacterium]|nr:hypothetical protein [Bacteroidales bacterium]